MGHHGSGHPPIQDKTPARDGNMHGTEDSKPEERIHSGLETKELGKGFFSLDVTQ